MLIFTTVLSILYVLLVGCFIYSWRKTKYFILDHSLERKTLISVIVTVRNEASCIAKLMADLNKQSYPKELFEVIFIDDASEDDTVKIIQDFDAKFRCRVLPLPHDPLVKAHKKKGIELGISQANGQLIVTTDGDCRVQPEWLSIIQNFYKVNNCKLIIGAVGFYEEETMFEKMQVVEFSSLVGTGAASVNMGFPNMCNGANLCYEKEVFYEMNGFAGTEDLPSGDDEFLMHKVFKKYPDKVRFLKNKDSVVSTHAKKNLKDFIDQRKRWAGKWNRYEINNIKFLAIFIFIYNLSLLLGLLLTVFDLYPFKIFLMQILVKITVEFLFLKEVMTLYNKRLGLFTFLLTELIYPFYATYFAFASKLGKYEWKGRKL